MKAGFLFLLPLFFFSIGAFGNASCTEKLSQKKWPLDCFMLLHLSKSSKAKKQKAYEDLNRWCALNEKELWRLPPPPGIFTLRPPKLCIEAAKIALKHKRAQDIMTGEFLNSFP